MANKHYEICSVSFVIRKLQIKTNLGAQKVKKDSGSIPGSGRSPGEGNGNPLQYARLENSLDRGAWCVTYSPWDCKELDMADCLAYTCTHTHTTSIKTAKIQATDNANCWKVHGTRNIIHH